MVEATEEAAQAEPHLKLVEEGADAEPAPIVWTWVMPKAVDQLWPRIRPLIAKSAAWADFCLKLEGIEDIKRKIEAGDYDLWIATEGKELLAVLVTDVSIHARTRVCTVHYGAGEQMERWLRSFRDELVERARSSGCRFIHIQGRDGWARALKGIGFQKAYTGYMLEI